MFARGNFLSFGALAFLVMTVSSAVAQSAASKVNVAVAIVPPFVMQENGSLTGFNIELWNAVATRLKLKTDYQLLPSPAALLEAGRSKKADILVTPVVITAARDEEFDFTFPIMQAGLQIMVRDTGESAPPNPLEDLLELLFSRTMLLWLGIALVLILIPAHLVWLLERRRENGMITNPKYIPGIFEAMYWAVSGLTSQAQDMPHHWLARAFSVFWMFAGVVFVAFYTAQLTTTLTVRQIQGAISGPDDLPGKQIATIANSTAADYLRTQKANVQEYASVDQMLKALMNKKADAVVFIAPVLLYFAAHEGKGLVKMVGPEFETAPIAFGMQLNSPLRKPIDRALLGLRENGTYGQLHSKWFGSP